MRRTLVVGIILLFIGVGVAPGITAHITNIAGDEWVDVTVELCRPYATTDYTMIVSQQDTYVLDTIFDDLKIRLMGTETREEVKSIYKDVVLLLDEQGWLPEGVTVDMTQRLVTGWDMYTPFTFLRRVFNGMSTENDDTGNTNCYFTGETTEAYFWIKRYEVLEYLMRLAESSLIVALFGVLPLAILIRFNEAFNNELIPFKFGADVAFGLRHQNFQGVFVTTTYYPASGWIYSMGQNGSKWWIGKTLYGNLSCYSEKEQYIAYIIDYYNYSVGATGFTGVKIKILASTYFIGYANQVDISYVYPFD